MARINGLDKMSFAELSELRDRVDAAMVTAKSAERNNLRAQMEAMAARVGLSLSEIVRDSRNQSRLKGTKVAVKYRNPKNSAETWTGRGRKPNWLVAALKKGQKLESFEI